MGIGTSFERPGRDLRSGRSAFLKSQTRPIALPSLSPSHACVSARFDVHTSPLLSWEAADSELPIRLLGEFIENRCGHGERCSSFGSVDVWVRKREFLRPRADTGGHSN